MGALWSPGILVVFILSVFLIFTVSSNSPSSNVSVSCDTYGVVVSWKSSLSDNAQFQLELRQNHGNPPVTIGPLNGIHHYNISAHLWDTGYNKYAVKVKAREGDEEWKDIGSSLMFTFNALMLAPVICNISFPKVELLPKDGQLVVRFNNPLHLYRNTPALRNLTDSDSLKYKIYDPSDKTVLEKSNCLPERDVCETTLSFAEEREEYCVVLSGSIRQTTVEETRHCYKGRLMPGPLVPVLVFFAVTSCLILIIICLAKLINKRITKKSLSKMPGFLKNMLTSPQLGRTLTPETERVEKNPQIEPSERTSSIQDPTEITILLPDSDTSIQSLEPHAPLGEDSPGKSSENRDLEQVGEGTVEDGSKRSSGGLSDGYDSPHVIEICPGEFVHGYGKEKQSV